MNRSAHDDSLRLVATDGADGRPEGIRLPPSPRLGEFASAAAARGLPPSEAVRLALERHFALNDARDAGVDPDTARRMLNERARATSAGRPLTRAEAARVRALVMGRPVEVADTGDGLRVTIPDRLLTRFGERVPARAFRARCVKEMVLWEIAATFEGRTMGEWALHTLAAAAA